MITSKSSRKFAALAILAGIAAPASRAAQIYWTDWQSGQGGPGPAFTGFGQITTPTSTIDVTYSNPQGIAFFQASGGADYWINNGPYNFGRNPATSPFTSSAVDNIPTGTDIIGLQWAGSQTLTFSQVIANPVFSYVSLNGNGYAFDQDFDILSYGDPNDNPGNPADGNDIGYWGFGTSYKQVVPDGNGGFLYELLGTGEPHGTLRFTGSFSTVTWVSLSNEFWNGFTVGVEGTSEEVFGPPVPEASPFLATALGLGAMIYVRRRQPKLAPVKR